jgi:hypothetical protein
MLVVGRGTFLHKTAEVVDVIGGHEEQLQAHVRGLAHGWPGGALLQD